MSRKRKGDFLADYQAWADQSGYTRMWTRSPAGGGQHPLRLHGSARALPRLALYVVVGAIALSALLGLLDTLIR